MRKMTDSAQALPGAASRLVLAPRLAVQDAAALLRNLEAHRGAALEIDASAIVEIGTPCVQVLLSAALSWRDDGQALAMIEPSPSFLATLGHLGLDPDALHAEGAAA